MTERPRSYLSQIKPLIDVPMAADKVVGLVGVTYAVIHSLVERGELPPPHIHTGRFYFTPTVNGVRQFLGDEAIAAFHQYHSDSDAAAWRDVRRYAQLADFSRYLAEAIGEEYLSMSPPSLFAYLGEDELTIDEIFEEDGVELLEYLRKEKGFNDEQIVVLVNQAKERRGLVLGLKPSILKLMNPNKTGVDLSERVFSVELSEGGISLEHLLTILPQCDFTRKRLSKVLDSYS